LKLRIFIIKCYKNCRGCWSCRYFFL